MSEQFSTKWSEYYSDIGLQPDLSARYMLFVEQCERLGIPPIFEQEHLAQLVGRDVGTLAAMIEGTSSFYRSFSMPKRSGGSRVISAPYPSLLEVQRWISDFILKKIPLPNYVTGYREGKSILDNALVHCRRAELVKIDLKDFFPSVGFRRVMFVFTRLGYPQNVAYQLARLCTLDDQLPQGAASSPSISNIVCRSMDAQFYRVCKKLRLRYTRYADDITISGRSISDGAKRLFFEIIRSEGFEVNQSKVRFLREGDRKIVTGLDITSGVPRVTRSFRRDLQKDVYFVWSAGLAAHVSRRRIFAPHYVLQLEGRVNFWAQIEPESAQLQKIKKRLQIIRSAHKW